jgi:hypothetical protein
MEYKLYILDQFDQIDRQISLICPSDESAEQVVAQHADGHAMELWQGERFLAHFPAPIARFCGPV